MTRITVVGWCGLVAVCAVAAAGCNRNQGPDPASANMAPADQAGQPADYQQAPGGEQLSEAPQPPPPLPEYSQPPCPGDNYLWTPGYWAYSQAGYYWVPGAWVVAPWVGALWTPPWWGLDNGAYLWHAGYWGPYVGFYGGINYGFGYTGRGFYGGYWRDNVFNYNRSVLNVNTRVVHNVYRRSVANYTPFNRVSYNGARGGVNVRANASESAAFRERRMAASPAQTQLEHEAAGNRAQFATENRGRPAMAAARPAPVAHEHPATEAPARTETRAPMEARPEGRAPMEASPRPESRPPNEPNARPEARPEARPPMEANPRHDARPEARPEPARSAPENRSAPEVRPAPRPPESHPPESHPPAAPKKDHGKLL